MPVTPLHYPLAKIIHAIDKSATLSLPALIVGSFVPDLEVPFVFLLSGTWNEDRMVLHSILGGLTLGVVIAVILTVFVYPRVIGFFFPTFKDRIKQKTSLSRIVVFSVALGVLSHVLLDVTNHLYNPLFWPFLSMFQTSSPIVILLGGKDSASLIVQGVMLLLLIIIFVKYRKNFWQKLLVG